MFRSKRELLNGLYKAMNGITETEPNEKWFDIEKYRDEDGFIDLTSIKDFKELRNAIDFIEKSCTMDKLNEGKENLQSIAEGLANELLPMLDADKVKISLETPEGKASVNLEKSDKKLTIKDDDIKNNYYTHVDLKNEKPQEIDKPVEKEEDETVGEICCDSEQDNEKSKKEDKGEPIAVIYDVGGNNNPLFMNAVQHICQNIHFPDCEVFVADGEYYPEDANVHILVPNAFGKMYEYTIDEFTRYFSEDDEIYVIDPETFELTLIMSPFELEDYAMTRRQEQIWSVWGTC